MPTAASTPRTESVVGLVLAAGAGRRMGGPKALVGPLAQGGRTPLAQVCDWVHEAGGSRVIAVLGCQADAVRAALAADPLWATLDASGIEPEHELADTSAEVRGEPRAHDPALNREFEPVSGRIGRSAPPDAQVVPAWLAMAEASDWESGMGASLRAGLAAASGTAAEVALVTLVDLPDVRTPAYARVLQHAAGSGTLARASFVGRPGHPVLIGRDWWDAAASAATGDQGARALFATHSHELIECGDLATGADADTP